MRSWKGARSKGEPAVIYGFREHNNIQTFNVINLKISTIKTHSDRIFNKISYTESESILYESSSMDPTS